MASAQLCFGKVHHTRLRPVRNAFNYGVYFLRLPLRSLEGKTPATRVQLRRVFPAPAFAQS